MPTPKPKRRWFLFSPDRLVVGLLLTVCLLWLSERFQWFGFNHHKGWTVLACVAAVGLAASVMLLWWIAGLIFHWRFQFGIRSLLVFCLTCSIAVGWLAVERDHAEKQRRAIEEITRLGGGVWYDFEIDASDNPIQGAKPPEPEWLRNLLGDDVFWNVTTVAFIRPGDYLDVAARDGSSITDAGLVNLKGFTQLKELQLCSSQVTDAGLATLTDLSHLRWLDLSGSKITDAGLVHITGLVQLEVLRLGGTKVTDAGLERLTVLTQLEDLALGHTQVSDIGLHTLRGLTQLRSLYLDDTGVTQAGVKKLQQALPNCEIVH